MKALTIPLNRILEADAAAPARRRGNRASRVPQIIEVSLDVLASEGYAGYTVTRVAKDSGIRLSTLQHYFPNREELLRATMREVVNRYFARYRKTIENKALTPEARLDAVVDDFIVEFSKPGLAAFLLQFWALTEREKFASDLLAELQKQFCHLNASLIAEINPGLSPEDCYLRATLIAAHGEGLIVLIRRGPDDLPSLDTLRSATKFIWNAISNAAA
ncbi:TetR family transcriptional regulator [Pandoraea terrae]|uniref:TetR family transcriptional regulator n=1 Tax=Pandoraea terrae TaxID=1537710 RepID=A0A5E4ZGX1_9BURK|nr:TetR family transcriptional regulator [Pandoraea terrae]VVE59675.1 TetR family transcriptional regulator [Pandoraea terrae]